MRRRLASSIWLRQHVNVPTGWSAFVASLLLVGCTTGALPIERPCTTYETNAVLPRRIESVDLLFVIDDGGTMAEEQAQLRAALPALVEGIITGDPTATLVHPARSLHIGVISGDMGAGDPPAGIEVPTCRPGLGGDGLLRSVPADCAGGVPTRIFSFARATDDESRFIEHVSCATDVGTGGCQFGQPLEAALKALSPAAPSPEVSSSYEAPIFETGTGHGDGVNAGFLRPDSVLAIVLLTDHDDCSVTSHDLFFAPAHAETPPALRCSRFPDALHPIERYVEGFSQLREAAATRVVFAALVGVPVDLAGGYPGYEPMLADPRMAEREIDLDGEPGADALAPSCDTEAGLAYPPRRIVELATGLARNGAFTRVESLCGGSLTAALDAIRIDIGQSLNPGCSVVPLGFGGAPPRRGCDMHVVLPAGMHCEELDLLYLDTELFHTVVGEMIEREKCLLPEVRRDEVGIEVGFYIDDFSDEVREACRTSNPVRFAFSRFALPPRAEARHVCTEAVLPTSMGVAQLGTYCSPHDPTGPNNLCAMGMVPTGARAFLCDPILRSCGVPCASDDDCPAAGLAGYTCDERSVREVVWDRDEDVPDIDGDRDVDEHDASVRYGFCTNPFCPGL